MRFMYVVKFFISGTMEICVSPKQLSNLCVVIFLSLLFWRRKVIFSFVYIFIV